MNVKSISELEQLSMLLGMLSALQEDVLNIEVDLLDLLQDSFLSYKLDFGNYTKLVVEGLYLYIDEFNGKIAWMYKHLADMVEEFNRRISILNLMMADFRLYSDTVFMHKSNRLIWQTERIEGHKYFADKDMYNDIKVNGVLTVEKVIEGTVKQTQYLT